MVRHCADCGEPMVEGKPFCPNCGARTDDSPVTKEAVGEPEAAVLMPPPPLPSPPVWTPTPSVSPPTPQDPKRYAGHNKSWRMLVAGLVLILFAGYVVSMDSNRRAASTTSDNPAEEGSGAQTAGADSRKDLSLNQSAY